MARNPAPRPAGAEEKSGTDGEVILVVDDDPAVRATAVMQLTRLGYVVREADGASAALRVIESAAKIDLLFTDVTMPDMNGKELAIQVRRRRPDLPILFASGFPGGSQGSLIVLDEDDVLLAKPYRKQELARIVRKMLGRRL
jgi:CheY-like chemotaxis protein